MHKSGLGSRVTVLEPIANTDTNEDRQVHTHKTFKGIKPLITVWAIRQKSTGAFLPARKNGRGYSFDEPSFDFPRLFHSKLSAIRALSAWLQGQWKNEWHSKGGSPWSLDPPEDYQSASPEKVDGRDPHDMEIVEFILNEVKSGH